jgi:hypothetical protein
MTTPPRERRPGRGAVWTVANRKPRFGELERRCSRAARVDLARLVKRVTTLEEVGRTAARVLWSASPVRIRIPGSGANIQQDV